MTRLTVKELREQLAEEDQDALVAFENFDGTGRTTLATECWQSGTFYMKPEPQVQDEYLCEDEVPAAEKDKYVKVLVLGTLVEKAE